LFDAAKVEAIGVKPMLDLIRYETEDDIDDGIGGLTSAERFVSEKEWKVLNARRKENKNRLSQTILVDLEGLPLLAEALGLLGQFEPDACNLNAFLNYVQVTGEKEKLSLKSQYEDLVGNTLDGLAEWYRAAWPFPEKTIVARAGKYQTPRHQELCQRGG
jgi:hypothetical protein